MGEKCTLGVRRIEALIGQLDARMKKEIADKCPGVSDSQILEEIQQKHPGITKAIALLEKHGFKVQYSRYDSGSDNLFRLTYEYLKRDDSEIRNAIQLRYREKADRLWLVDTLEDAQKIMSEE